MRWRGPVRTMVVWCPDWPVRAAGGRRDEKVAVVRANRVVAASAPARAEGVTVGARRRQAESRCPGLRVLPADDDRDARAFEAVVSAVAAFTPLVEVTRPGLCGFAARGPARYFGGEDALAARLAEAVDAAGPGGVDGGPPCRVGVADGPFAAAVAARRGIAVPPGATAEFLAPLPVSALGRPDLADLLGRLGVGTLGAFAALPARQVLARFGADGLAAHRLARGMDDRPLAARPPVEDLAVAAELDPPLDRVDAAAFAAKALADRLVALLANRGLRATQVRIEAHSDHGEESARVWRHDGALSSSALSDRVRWQLEGWLTGPRPPTAGVVLLRLEPEEVTRDQGSQDGFWGGTADSDVRAARGLARVHGLLGPEGVFTAVADGGRGPAERIRLVPWGDERRPALAVDAPWPGRVPPPAPALVLAEPTPARLLDADGSPVVVAGRGGFSAPPATLAVGSGAPVPVTGWSTPWPVLERWWDPHGHRRRARVQVSTIDGRAHLLVVEAGRWVAEAVYD